ncbi:glycosyltransferase family 4 protein [Yinghuangia seranimata]|uniref:glycosyltransferase family 4 protein n=1 Tax=Yinghuangia seranimata TaxID=408067 RepID=UPI00248C9A44|nr:glycosyltransferase family 4 protein [Yinghuangia seranimata]MDI2132247.1 glycosyltransferase family 4 protein [Yinghuangia seranimata]
MRVMVFGTYDATVHPRVGILVEGLQRQGVDVVVCNAALGIDDAGPARPPRRREGVARARLRHVARLAELACRARRLPRPDVVLCGYRGRVDIQVARRLFPHVPLLLDHLESVDDAADRTGRAPRAGLRFATRVEASAIRAADLVLVDTEEHRRVLPARDRDRTVVVPIGAAPVWFDAGRALGDGEPPAVKPVSAENPLRIVAFGHYSPVQGAPVIGAALRQLDGYPLAVTMVGRGLQLQRTRDLVGRDPRVRWHAWVPGSELPRLVARHDVCLGVFGTGAKALRLVPNKVFQGAAVGCAVVTSDTAPQQRMLGRAARFVPAGNADALADTIRRLAGHPADVARLRAAAVEVARERFTPQAVVEPLVERLERMVGKGS